MLRSVNGGNVCSNRMVFGYFDTNFSLFGYIFNSCSLEIKYSSDTSLLLSEYFFKLLIHDVSEQSCLVFNKSLVYYFRDLGVIEYSWSKMNDIVS